MLVYSRGRIQTCQKLYGHKIKPTFVRVPAKRYFLIELLLNISLTRRPWSSLLLFCSVSTFLIYQVDKFLYKVYAHSKQPALLNFHFSPDILRKCLVETRIFSMVYCVEILHYLVKIHCRKLYFNELNCLARHYL